MICRTRLGGHSLERKLRALSFSCCCSAVSPKSMHYPPDLFVIPTGVAFFAAERRDQREAICLQCEQSYNASPGSSLVSRLTSLRHLEATLRNNIFLDMRGA